LSNGGWVGSRFRRHWNTYGRYSDHNRPNVRKITSSIEIDIHGTDDPRVRAAVLAAVGAAGVTEAHVAIALVGPDEIRSLNRRHRGLDVPTAVLSFPVDGAEPAAGPRELGDVVICPEHTEDLVEAVVHGVLHLCGYDHEADDGEMLALQDRVMDGLR
jgi:probable rRNA maturation factor